ncbi:MAG: accessory gene regulator B family protein [Firmicutes bacterium]|nr:accessory gene regulator B family protein [Bacillota bacterium]
MLARLARIMGMRLAAALELPQEAADKAAFALENLFLFVATFGAILLSAAALDLLWPALAASLTGALMRAASGGAHLGRPGRCILVSTLLALGLGWAGRAAAPFFIPPVSTILVLATAAAGMVVLFLYAPADTPAKPIPVPQRRVLRAASLALLGAWLIALLVLPSGRDLPAASLFGLLWQIFTITPAGYRLYHVLDRAADGLTGRKGGELECGSSS